ncbi:polyprenyl diphosphate synthase [Caviibacter abscessus]|uniref:polyprenyl diphosphate synthase n=1 Tax=Caviibacter abscessus TaxID=1766719 RepID=UPI000831FC77
MDNIPKHIAIIMDGNGRWGKQYNGSRSYGHKIGAQVLENTIKDCLELGISYLSVYAFSTENWKRSSIEVSTILKLFYSYLENKKNDLMDKNVKLVVSGSTNMIPDKLLNKINETCEYLKNNKKMVFNICFNYGGRQEIIEAINKIIKDKKEFIDTYEFQNYLYSPKIPDPDLVIRTGGETRISNFLLWQISYSELYFTDVLWPDFNKDELKKAIEYYSKKDRRYGGLNVK